MIRLSLIIFSSLSIPYIILHNNRELLCSLFLFYKHYINEWVWVSLLNTLNHLIDFYYCLCVTLIYHTNDNLSLLFLFKVLFNTFFFIQNFSSFLKLSRYLISVLLSKMHLVYLVSTLVLIIGVTKKAYSCFQWFPIISAKSVFLFDDPSFRVYQVQLSS